MISIRSREAHVQSTRLSLSPRALPTALTDMVGRESSIAAVADLIVVDGKRLVTVTGPGGVGKTRFALAVGEDIAPHFEDGVVFVPLATVSDPADIISRILDAVGGRQSGEQLPFQDLAALLGDAHTLIILDNFEQLVAGAPVLVDLLGSCPETTILVTSRMALRLREEQAYPLPTLSVSEEDDENAQSEAERLFIDRMLARNRGAEISEVERHTIRAICRELDGLPLALELAAARTTVLPLETLWRMVSAGEGSHLRVLSGGPRDAPVRHRSLEDTIAWSYDQLDETERQLLHCLAMFPGGFSLEVVLSICSPGQVGPRQQVDVIEDFTSLIEKNMLAQRDVDGERRYFVLATIREYLRQRQSSNVSEVVRNHADHYLQMSEDAAEALTGPRQGDAIRRLRLEHPNLLAALTTFADQNDIESAHRLAWSLFFYWWHRGLVTESKYWYERLLEMNPLEAGATRPWVEYAAATRSCITEDFTAAIQQTHAAIASAQRLGDSAAEGSAYTLLSYTALAANDFDNAIRWSEIALSLLESGAEGFWLANGLAEAGMFMSSAGDPERGIPAIEQALALDLQRGDALLGGVRQSDLGLILHDLGQESKALENYLLGIDSLVAGGGIWYLASPMAGVAALRGADSPADATQLIGAATEIRRQAGTKGWATELERDRATVELAKSALGGDYNDLFERGRRLSLDQAVNLARRLAKVDVVPDQTDQFSGLTKRERQVLHLIAEGRSDREIADELFISVRTASKHVSNILAKIGVATRSEAAAMALRHERAGAQSGG